MINLLPKAEKKQIRAARSNVLLLRYLILALLIAAMLVVSIGVTYFFLQDSERSATKKIAENRAKQQDYASINKRAETFSKQLTDAKAVFASDTSYSKTILAIAKLIPDGVVLSRLELSETSFSSPLVLNVQVKNEQAAMNLKRSFEDSPNFSGASFSQFTKSDNSSYPYAIDLTVTMSKEVAK